MTRLELFDYRLPEELIAHYPSEDRDASRLLVVDRESGHYVDRRFSDLPSYLREGDVLVLNDSRVIPARLFGHRQGTGARIELFLLKPHSEQEAAEGEGRCWEALARPARRLKEGDTVCIADGFDAHIVEKAEGGLFVVQFDCQGSFLETLERVGTMPLPPYIRRPAEELDSQRYQTVYARVPGSVAAPTAGLHFTDGLLAKLRGMGVQTAFVTLNVGLGTFRPVQSEEIEGHRMHEEAYHISEEAASQVNAARIQGRRVICVGTTSVRAIESAAQPGEDGEALLRAGWGSTDIFLYPGGHGFSLTDGLITNFHLPKSTLLMLVAAFAGREKVLAAYGHAIKERYRFFSYGDAMFLTDACL
jgi:S-adenosylmethionine:tRNA ribosyltransferase-isomerase